MFTNWTGNLFLTLNALCSILFQAIAIMNVAFGKDHHYIAEVKKEMEEQK